jgi:hypothetical protein
MYEDLVVLDTPFLEDYLQSYMDVNNALALELLTLYLEKHHEFFRAAFLMHHRASAEYVFVYCRIRMMRFCSAKSNLPLTLCYRGEHLTLTKRSELLATAMAHVEQGKILGTGSFEVSDEEIQHLFAASQVAISSRSVY